MQYKKRQPMLTHSVQPHTYFPKNKPYLLTTLNCYSARWHCYVSRSRWLHLCLITSYLYLPL